MRTTIELPEELFERAQEQAARRGVDVNQFIAAAVMSEVKAASAATLPPSLSPRPRSKLPTIRRKGTGTIPNLTAELEGRMQEEEDLASHHGSFGR